MGWCSATEIMDTAVQAAEKVAHNLLDLLGQDDLEDGLWRPTIDAGLAPFVAKLAEHLRDGDWDCVEDSAYFDRFPREMLGLDDGEWERWLVDKIKDTDYDVPTRRKWMRTLEAFYQKGEADG